MYLVIKPHVCNCHSVLCECSSLIWANGWGWSQSFNSFQILYKTVLWSHAFSSQGEADSDSCKKTFWHISNNDTNEEDDSIQPVVAKDESNDEKADTQEDSHSGLEEGNNIVSGNIVNGNIVFILTS